MTHRFIRTELLLGKAALARLQHAQVTVVGLGAVGSYAVEGLVRSGVGRLRLVDFDMVRASNINRQLYALESTLGRLKTDLARERILDINPACEVDVRNVFIDEQTAAAVLEPRPDVLVDAIDSLNPKVFLLGAAIQAGVPVVSSMGAAKRLDPLAIRVGDLADTRGCSLARLVRKRLRSKYGIRRGVHCVYSIEPVHKTGPADAPVLPPEKELLRRGRPRQPIGSFSCLTGIFGLVAAREAIMRLLNDRAFNG